MVPLKNARIKELPASAGPKAGYLLAMFNLDNDTTEKVPVDFFMSSGTSGDFEWLSETAYSEDQVVTYGGKWWQAQQAVPENILPGTDALYWVEISKSPSGLVMWQAGVYTEDEVFVVYELAGLKTLYYLADPARPYVSSDFETELTAGDWEAIGGDSTGVVESVTGDGVNNTDPANPVLTFPVAAEVDFTPSGSISATNVDGALQELDGEKQSVAEKGQANGYAPLGADTKIASTYLPSYVDDVIEVADFASLPVTGETGKIYITLDNNNQYRWSGSSYIQIVSSPGSTDAVPEGATNLYFTTARVRATVLTGLSVLTNLAILATDTVLEAFGKLQAQITAALAAIPAEASQVVTDAGTDGASFISSRRLFGKFKAKTSTSAAFNVDATNDLKTIVATPSGPINATINTAAPDVIVSVMNFGAGTIFFVNGTATFSGINSLLPNKGAIIRYTAAGTAVIVGGSTIPFDNITSKPTTVAGYGITDASRAIFATGTTVTSVGTTETTLATGNIPANTLGTDLGHIRAVFVGQIGASAPNKTLKVKLGATTLYDSGLIPIAGAVDFEIQIKMMRTAGNAQRGSITIYSNSGTVAGVKYFTAAEDLTTLLALAVTGTVASPGGTEISGTMFYAVKEGI